jgi:hypothetical protein
MTDRFPPNRFMRRFGLTTPIALAPMALASGGELAAACAKAGALGLIGGGYGDLDWTACEYSIAAQALSTDPQAASRLGCGFITWKMAQDRSALDFVLDRPAKPAALMLSFGDPTPFARDIIDRGIPLVCQIQTMAQLPQAVDAGASAIVAQGAEAGGHGMNAVDGRSTFTFVPEIADWLAARAPEVDLLAAGGVSDGRGLAAAMTLGADGALIGSRCGQPKNRSCPTRPSKRRCEPAAMTPRARPCSTSCARKTGPRNTTSGVCATPSTANGRIGWTSYEPTLRTRLATIRRAWPQAIIRALT